MTPDQAYALGMFDGSRLVAIAQAAHKAAGDPAGPTRALLVDGTQFSPSWRAYGSGDHVWQADESGEGALTLAYEEGLDEVLEGADGLAFTWEDGMLWADWWPDNDAEEGLNGNPD